MCAWDTILHSTLERVQNTCKSCISRQPTIHSHSLRSASPTIEEYMKGFNSTRTQLSACLDGELTLLAHSVSAAHAPSLLIHATFLKGNHKLAFAHTWMRCRPARRSHVPFALGVDTWQQHTVARSSGTIPSQSNQLVTEPSRMRALFG